MNYGVPYMGSKNRIAKEIIELLPSAETFVDLFCGGCAMTHAAILSGKYNNFVINDIDWMPTQLFLDAIDGKYLNHYKWVSREDFFAEKDKNPFVKYIYSFGNNGKTYLFNSDNEREKSQIFESVVEDVDSIEEKRKTSGNRLQNIERINRLNGLVSLQPYLRKITRYNKDYRLVDIPANSVVYCDIPYRETATYNGQTFNYQEFYDWAAGMDNLFISEKNIDDERFMKIWEKDRKTGFSPQKNITINEKLYKPII